MTLLEILNNVLAESGFLTKTSFATNQDPDDKQMVAIANRTITELRDFYPWSSLRSDFQISPPDDDDSEMVTFALPGDFRSFCADSSWELDGSRMLEWPVPSSRWFLYKFSSFSSGGLGRVRQYGNTVQIQSPGNWQPFEFEYISKFAVRGANGTQKEYFTADTDTPVLDDRLVTLGIQANWAETKLLPQAGIWKQNYMQKTAEAIGRDTGAKTIGPNTVDGVSAARGAPYYPLWRPS